jgi:hypothetical protein
MNLGVAGASRSAAIVVCFLMQHRQMSLSQAVLHVKDRRAKAGPNDGFIDVLLQLEPSCCSGTSDKSEVLAVTKKKWLAEYRAGTIKLNPMDQIL